MDLAKMTIKEIESILVQGEADQDFLEACSRDGRKALQRLVRRYERELQEKERVADLYHFEELSAAEGLEIVAGVDEAGRGRGERRGDLLGRCGGAGRSPPFNQASASAISVNPL